MLSASCIVNGINYINTEIITVIMSYRLNLFNGNLKETSLYLTTAGVTFVSGETVQIYLHWTLN